MDPAAESSSSGKTTALLLSYSPCRQNLIPILQDVQDADGYLAPEAVDRIAAHLELSAHDVFGVATFFSQFRFNPPGKHCIKVCEGTACHVRGSAMLVDLIARR